MLDLHFRHWQCTATAGRSQAHRQLSTGPQLACSTDALTNDIIQQVGFAHSCPATQVQLQVREVHVQVIVRWLIMKVDAQSVIWHLEPFMDDLQSAVSAKML